MHSAYHDFRSTNTNALTNKQTNEQIDTHGKSHTNTHTLNARTHITGSQPFSTSIQIAKVIILLFGAE